MTIQYHIVPLRNFLFDLVHFFNLIPRQEEEEEEQNNNNNKASFRTFERRSRLKSFTTRVKIKLEQLPCEQFLQAFEIYF